MDETFSTSNPASGGDVPGEPLWRDALGERLRESRQERGETLSETAERAGISPQYLSEIERGLKEPSSEMIAAVAGALDTSLGELTLAVAERLLVHRIVSNAVVIENATSLRPRGPVCVATYTLAA